VLQYISYLSVYPGGSYAHARCATSSDVKKYQQWVREKIDFLQKHSLNCVFYGSTHFLVLQ
jgi:hypothetical protein